jgi:phosphoglycolate phosphatase
MTVRPAYDIVMLDLDGTLVDSLPGVIRSLRHGIDAIGMPQPSNAEMVHFLGPPLHDTLMGVFGRSAADVEVMFSAYQDVYFGDAEYDFVVYDGLSELVIELHQRGVQLILATAKPHESATRILQHANLLEPFDFVSGSELDFSRQEKTEVLRYAFEQVGIDPATASIVMIGDRETDITAAQEFGIDSIAVTWGFAPAGELEAAKATHYAADALELRALLLT